MPDSDISPGPDAATEPGPDAATWTPQGGPRSYWDSASPAAMIAVLVGNNTIRTVHIGRRSTGRDIARLVGDPRIECLGEITGTDIWAGEDRVFSHPRNQLATLFYTMLLKDITTGDYAASDDDREHIRELLAHEDFVPIIHGPCLVVGVNHQGDTVPLGETFRHWFEKLIDRISTERNPEIRRALATATGVHPADVDNIITFEA